MLINYLYKIVEGDYKHYTNKVNGFIKKLDEVGAEAKNLDFEFDVVRMLFPLNADYFSRIRIKENAEDIKTLLNRNKLARGECERLKVAVDKKYECLSKMNEQFLSALDAEKLSRLQYDQTFDKKISKMNEEVKYQTEESDSLGEELAYWKSKGMGLTV